MFSLDQKLASSPIEQCVYRPLLRISIGNKGRTVSCLGIVDSGADYCLFPSRIMRELALDVTSPVKSVAVGSESETYPHKVSIAVVEIPAIEPFAATIGFVDNMNDDWVFEGQNVGLLGQNGFFDHFKVHFDFRNRAFELEPYDSSN